MRCEHRTFPFFWSSQQKKNLNRRRNKKLRKIKHFVSDSKTHYVRSIQIAMDIRACERVRVFLYTFLSLFYAYAAFLFDLLVFVYTTEQQSLFQGKDINIIHFFSSFKQNNTKANTTKNTKTDVFHQNQKEEEEAKNKWRKNISKDTKKRMKIIVQNLWA